MNNKMVFGIMITLIGLAFSLSCFGFAALNPGIYNDIGGLFGALLCADMLWPFIISFVVMCGGICICFVEAYVKNK